MQQEIRRAFCCRPLSLTPSIALETSCRAASLTPGCVAVHQFPMSQQSLKVGVPFGWQCFSKLRRSRVVATAAQPLVFRSITGSIVDILVVVAPVYSQNSPRSAVSKLHHQFYCHFTAAPEGQAILGTHPAKLCGSFQLV
jgi:hypothetical protein